MPTATAAVTCSGPSSVVRSATAPSLLLGQVGGRWSSTVDPRRPTIGEWRRRAPEVPDIAEPFGPEGRASSTTLNRRPEMSTGSIRTKRGFGAACHENNGSSTASNRSWICSISTAWPLTTTLHASPLAWS